jgi:hypothetical protein
MADCVASVAGPWTTVGTWTGGAVPTDGQSVEIANGIVVTYDDNHGPLGKAWATGINGIVLDNASSGLVFSLVTPAYLMMKTGTNISGTGYVNIGSGAVNSATAIPVPASVTAPLTEQAEINDTQITIADTTGFIVGQTIYIVKGTGQTAVRETRTIATLPGSGVITFSGALVNQYTTATVSYVTQLHRANATIEWHGAAAAGTITATGADTINGAISTTPAAHPAYTQLYANATVGDGYIDIFGGADAFVVTPGTQILIGCISTDNNIYTCTKYEVAGGGAGVNRIHIYPFITTTNRVGNSSTAAPENVDYVARYSRSIIASRANYFASNLMPAAQSPTISGVLAISQMLVFTNTNPVTINSCTTTAGTSTSMLYSLTYSKVNDCVAYGNSNAMVTGSYNVTRGCIGINNAFLMGDSWSTHYNLVSECCNTLRYTLSGGAGSTIINPVCRGSQLIIAGSGPYSIYGARTSASAVNDITMAATVSTGMSNFYNCTFGGTTSTIANYTTIKPPNSSIRSFNTDGIAGYRRVWCRGGVGTTKLPAPPVAYNAADLYGTMKFTTDATLLNTPIFWDTKFFLPANKTITFNVPMYATTSEGVTGAVWVFDPINDPLVGQQFNGVTSSFTPSTPTIGINAEQVIAISSMPTPNSAWNVVPLTVPAQTSPRELIVRVIFMGTTASKNAFTYLSNMDHNLLKTVREYL